VAKSLGRGLAVQVFVMESKLLTLGASDIFESDINKQNRHVSNYSSYPIPTPSNRPPINSIIVVPSNGIWFP